jgi:ABC-type spermidine/putrescine transport system permease subunit II
MSDYKTHRENDLGIGKGWMLGLFTAGVVLFLFFPIVVLIAYSFNESRYVSHWGGFSWKWYRVMIEDRQLWFAIENSLLIAGISTIVSTVLGTMAALVLGKYVFRGKNLFQNLLYVPIIIPEIIFGIALLIFFVTIPCNGAGFDRFPRISLQPVVCDVGGAGQGRALRPQPGRGQSGSGGEPVADLL